MLLLSWIICSSPVYIRFILLSQNGCSFQRFHRDGVPFRLRFTSALPKSATHINHSVSQKHQVLNLFSACQITDLKRRHRSVSCPARLALQQADTGTSHRLTHLNLRDILTHIKLKDKLFLHYIAQFCTRKISNTKRDIY